MQCRSHSRRRTSECLFVTACSMDEYAEEKRTEKNLIVRSGIFEAETTVSHAYADDTQIYGFCPPSAISVLQEQMSACSA